MESDACGERKEMRKNGSPELKASLLSILTWHWFNPFISMGNQKIIQEEDFYDLNPRECTEYSLERWNNAMEEERKKSHVPSVAKILSMKFVALTQTNSGVTLNIIMNDTQKLQEATLRLTVVAFTLVEIITIGILGVMEAGVSTIPGVAIILLTLPLQDVMSPVASLVTFGTYMMVHKGQFILPSKAFTVLALFNILVKSFNMVPLGIQYAGEAIVAIQRLQRFLNLPDCNHLNDEQDIDKVPSLETNHEDCAVVFSDCCFSWDIRAGNLAKINSEAVSLADSKISPHEGEILCSVNLVVKKGEFISVVGPVGSGKTSLLYGILGELQTIHGPKIVQRNVAYVPQQSWILNASVIRNIIFTNDFDKQRYNEIVYACALEMDIAQLPAGHHTEIGERGVNLSGGQKARISLARACYSFSEVVILDDPLAAVDVTTAKHLIQHVLYGILKNRTVILATHNEAALELSDRVYTIQNKNLQTETKRVHDKKTIQQEYTIDEKNIGFEATIDRTYTGDTMISSVHNQDIEIEKPKSSSIKDPDQQMKLDAVWERKTCSRSDPTKNQDQSKGRLTIKEDRVEGNVKISTFLAYIKEARGFMAFSMILTFFGVAQSVRVMLDYWLGVWTQKKYNLKPELYAGVYAIVTLCSILLYFSRSLLFIDATMVAAARLHARMMEKVLYSPQLFFDQNTVGRIVNRVSKDQSVVDEILPFSAKQSMEIVLAILGYLVMIAILIPWFLLFIPPFVAGLFYFQHRYLVVSQAVKRIYSLSQSPIYAYFSQALQGAVSIRAYSIESKARQEFIALLDANNQAYIHFAHASRWMGIRLDIVASMVVCATSFLVVLFRNSLGPGIAGVVLIQALQMTTFFQLGIRFVAELQNHFTSVERLHDYTFLPEEANPYTEPGIIENDWPSKGELVFINYTMAYRDDLPPVLNGISFKVYAKEKIGILGRTGAGKSSLAVALFRMVENSKCSGDILIDGINIKSVGLQDLRKRISIIPQDPSLFKGTLRFNMDPFEIYTDAQIWEALSKVHLKGKLQSLKGLDSLVAENGENFSVGERQLMCLARSLLRRSQIIVMDEATASVDTETDGLIQTTVRTVLRNCTVLTIAHRIDTVIDCDRVLTIANGGHVAEFDSPANLLRQAEEGVNGGGVFASMVEEAGAINAQHLRDAAEAAQKKRVQLKQLDNIQDLQP